MQSESVYVIYWCYTNHVTLKKMTSLQVVEMLVSVILKGPSWDYSHPDGCTLPLTVNPLLSPQGLDDIRRGGGGGGLFDLLKCITGSIKRTNRPHLQFPTSYFVPGKWLSNMKNWVMRVLYPLYKLLFCNTFIHLWEPNPNFQYVSLLWLITSKTAQAFLWRADYWVHYCKFDISNHLNNLFFG